MTTRDQKIHWKKKCDDILRANGFHCVPTVYRDPPMGCPVEYHWERQDNSQYIAHQRIPHEDEYEPQLDFYGDSSGWTTSSLLEIEDFSQQINRKV